MECNFLNESFNVEEQIAGVLNVSVFVMRMIHVLDSYRDGKFYNWEVVLLNKVSVDA